MTTSPSAQAELYVPDRRLGCHLLYYGQVDSTMDVAWRLADGGFSEGAAVVAKEQTKGRGRFNRAWVGRAGGSLYLSVLVRPDQARASLLSVIASLAVAQAVQRLTKARCTIKWPNDVRIDGKKVCGILVETRADASRAITEAEGSTITAVVGMGLNLDMDFSGDPDLFETATSLRTATGRRIEVERAADAVLDEMNALYDQALSGADLVALWREMLDTLGQQVTVRWTGGEELGLAEEVAADGGLVLRRTDGTRVVLQAGEVTLHS
jgi:BirA family biotin operon repressor/biotin-[acetyl-CoA-carboxylase] ligase